MPEHPGLCHSATLRYTVSAELRENKHALRSLSHILRTDITSTMETVTSTVLLHRVEELADPDERNDFHIRGTVSLLSRIGLVEYDEFGASIIRETYGLLLPYNTTTV